MSKNLSAIIKKELRVYFNTPMGYILMVVFLLITNWFSFFWNDFFRVGQADLRNMFEVLPMVFLIFAPAVTMRLWAEETNQGTAEILLTLPVKAREVIFGKYLSAMAFLALSVALTFPMVVTVAKLGDPDMGPVIGGYLGTLLMGAAYVAIGFFASSISGDQIIAFVLGIFLCLILFIVGMPSVLAQMPGFLKPLCQAVSLKTHFDSIAKGVIDLRDILYYVSIIVIFLYMTISVITKKR